MAIMKCEECGGDVSTKAATCPKCGAPAPTDADYEMLQSRLKKEQEEHEAEKRRQKEKREKKRLEEEKKKKGRSRIQTPRSGGKTPSKGNYQ